MQIAIGLILLTVVATALIFGYQKATPTIPEPEPLLDVATTTEEVDQEEEPEPVVEELEAERESRLASLFSKPKPKPAPKPAPAPKPQPTPTPAPQPAAPTPTPAPKPTYTPDTSGAVKGSIESFDLNLTRTTPVAIPGTDNSLVITGVSTSGGDSTARIEVRTSTGISRYELGTNASRELPATRTYAYALEVRSIDDDENAANVIVRRFPKNKIVPEGANAEVLAMPLQTIYVGDHTVLAIEQIERHKVSIQVLSYENGSLAREYTSWYQKGGVISTPDLRADINQVINDTNYFYDSTDARWGPHLVDITVTPR